MTLWPSLKTIMRQFNRGPYGGSEIKFYLSMSQPLKEFGIFNKQHTGSRLLMVMRLFGMRKWRWRLSEAPGL